MFDAKQMLTELEAVGHCYELAVDGSGGYIEYFPDRDTSLTIAVREFWEKVYRRTPNATAQVVTVLRNRLH